MRTRITDCYYKASDNFINKFYKQLKEYSLTLEQFCKRNQLDLYMTQKVMDKNIKMGVDYHFLTKIAKLIDLKRGIIIGEQPIAKHGKDYSERKKILY